MKTLYLDCGMGAAGDMLTAALFELLDDKEGFLRELNSAGIPDVVFTAESSVKCGITGTHMHVMVHGTEEGDEVSEHHHHDHDHDHHEYEHDHDHDHDHHEHDHDHDHHEHDHDHHHDHHDHDHHGHDHHHSSMADIRSIIESLHVSENVKQNAGEVYRLIAEAESRAHNKPVTEIHFHEVGTMDAVADITAVCLLMEKLHPEKVLASAVHVGSGHVHCAHGILPVPAPATAYILQNIPMYGGKVQGELCTPTGAALLRHFVDSFGEMPAMKVERIGYGMGKKDFEYANCLRAMLGETPKTAGEIVEFTCNLDDMSAEKVGFAMECLLEAGALEVYTVPVGMKKSRPGILLCVMCREEQRDEMIRLIFKHTTTLGIRENISRRYTLHRYIEHQKTPYGDVRMKVSEGYGTRKMKYEYEDLARIARESGQSISEVETILKNAAD